MRTNPKIDIEGAEYEVYWTTERAQHIAKRHFDPQDVARHLDFNQIQEVLRTYDGYDVEGKYRWVFWKRLADGKRYAVYADIYNKRCYPVSGRIDNRTR